MLSIFALLPLLATLLFAPAALAQDKTVENYPQWVTNDYKCVIKCLEIFNDKVTARPSPETELQATQCIVDGCNKDTMGMNIYQSHYIIQMFYATGSIFEDPNMGTWGTGTPPDQQHPQESKPAENPQGGSPGPSSIGQAESPAPSDPGPVPAGSSATTPPASSGGSTPGGAPKPSTPAQESAPENAGERSKSPTGLLAMAVAAVALSLSTSVFA